MKKFGRALGALSVLALAATSCGAATDESIDTVGPEGLAFDAALVVEPAAETFTNPFVEDPEAPRRMLLRATIDADGVFTTTSVTQFLWPFDNETVPASEDTQAVLIGYGGGRELFRQPFDVGRRRGDEIVIQAWTPWARPGRDTTFSALVDFPGDPSLEILAVELAATEVWRTVASDNAPAVTLAVDDSKVSWTATDLDGTAPDVLVYFIAADGEPQIIGGDSLTSQADGDTRIDVNEAGLRDGAEGHVVVFATDGFHYDVASAGPFTIEVDN